MQVPQERLNRVLEIYQPDCRFLLEANADYPKAEGKFRVGITYYTTSKVEHMTSIEAQLCLNQLCFSAFGEWLPQGRFDKTINFEEYLRLMKENMFIVESSIRFRKPIPTDRDLQGQIEVMKIKRHGDLYLACLNYEVEESKSKGNLKLALKLS